MLGDDALFPDPLLTSADAPTGPTYDAGALPDVLQMQGAAADLPTPDKFGALTVPTTAQASFGAQPNDPCLSMILAFLQAFVATDANATASWAAVNPAGPPIARTFLHNPADVVFSDAWLPALFMWRESATLERYAEDYFTARTQVKGLWVFPLALPDNQRQRAPAVTAITDAIAVGLERGRTPSFVIPNDPDYQAASLGSWIYNFAGLDRFALDSWRVARLIVPNADDTSKTEVPAIEMTFGLVEHLTVGTHGTYPNQSSFLALQDAAENVLEQGPLGL